jgi:hypothetical protein
LKRMLTIFGATVVQIIIVGAVVLLAYQMLRSGVRQ